MKHETSDEFIRKKEKEFKKNPTVKIKDIGRKGHHIFKRTDWSFLPQSGHSEKVFVVEKLKRDKGEGKLQRNVRYHDIEYRIGYYIVGKKGNKNGKWIWGQFCPFIPKEDINKLISKIKFLK